MSILTTPPSLAVVTGAASGIGRALALRLAEQGCDLALCDVDETGLHDTLTRARDQGVAVYGERVDVAEAAQVNHFAEATRAELGVPELVINNAGIGVAAGFLDTTLEDWQRVLSINVMGVVHGCRAFAPMLVDRQRGQIANVASSAGLAASQLLSAYSATKFAVVGLSGALRQELAPRGVGVTAVCPGLIDTAIVHSTEVRGWQSEERARARGQRAFARRGYSPERAAGAILQGLARNPAILPVAPEAWAIHYLRRLAPWTLEWMDTRMGELGRKLATRG